MGVEIQDLKYGKLFITTSVNRKPEYTLDTSTGADYMNNHLEVDGSTRLDGRLNIVEQNGTVASANNGTILLDHENNGGASPMTFRSSSKRGIDYGYIQYQDASYVGAGGERARLIIGTQNDTDDHLILAGVNRGS